MGDMEGSCRSWFWVDNRRAVMRLGMVVDKASKWGRWEAEMQRSGQRWL